jgi:Glycosyl hydrolases family 2, TIM barrel domain/Glycosyl hydrolases family 2, sugar binding domain/Beta galactosidase small chain/Glycosyl hydrolases family 2
MSYTRLLVRCAGLSVFALPLSGFAQAPRLTTARQYLSGTGSDSTILWEFRVSGGRQAGHWSTIPVPSNWEMQGFGTYKYGDDWSRTPAPDSIGEYRHLFRVPASWRGTRVSIVIGAAMTDTDVRINGRSAGPTHRGGFYQFRYDVTDLVKVDDENVLEMTVRKFSTDSSVNRAERQSDFWLFGGIFRPVWLEAAPVQYIAHIAIDARHTGAFRAEVDVDNASTAEQLVAQVEQLDGTPVGHSFSTAVPRGSSRVTVVSALAGVKPWSAEWPNRYRVRVRLVARGAPVHEVLESFGFRTVEVRPHDGFYVNGVPVHLKGSNRHSFWPTTGRATNKALSIADVKLMKEMNMNAVRMSHYPPDSHFLDACDSLGLFVLDELTGWQKSYSTAAGMPLVPELVNRDVNHPSIVLWDNGNEGGWNTALDGEFAKYDPQKRTVIHPWQNFNGINTGHYELYDCCAGWLFHGDDLIMPTEFMHGLYDGGAGAGLEEWWNATLASPVGVGGFIWSFADEGIVRADQGGKVDVSGNLAHDGILGPFREKEASFYTIKRLWAPVYIPRGEQSRLPATFDGTLRVENRYDATDLRHVAFTWELLNFPAPGAASLGHIVSARGAVALVSVPPRGSGTLQVKLPSNWRTHHAFALTATDPHGNTIYTWTWMISAPAVASSASASPGVSAETKEGTITMHAGDTEVRVDATTGRLAGLSRAGKSISLRDGPRLVEGTATLKSIVQHADGSDYVIEASYDGELQRIAWRLSPSGWLRLDYSYRPRGAHAYLGVTFDYPEEQVTGMRWLGRGPYRVYKNRLKGVEFDVWHKDYNDTQTGLSWNYPEFKGFHSDMYWATLETREAPITFVFGSPEQYLRVLTPTEPTASGSEPRNAHMVYPPGDISFLRGIAPIGTKFTTAAQQGPAGLPNLVGNHRGTYEDTVWLYVGDVPPRPAITP